MMKSIIVIALMLLAGLASAYTPAQQSALDTVNLGFKLGMAYEQASQGQNVSEYNTLVDEYNTWIREQFGADASLLLKPKMSETTTNVVISPQSGVANLESTFNSSSDLSKFGRNEAYTASGVSSTQSENAATQQTGSSFLTSNV
jgi:hypothetical protein